MEHIIGLKEFREHVNVFARQVAKGKTFVVVRRSRPLFKIAPLSDETEPWEPIADFTKIKKGGVALHEILARL